MSLLIRLFSQFLIIISIILFFYILYKSELVWNGEKREYYKIYYLLNFLLLVFSISSFYFKPKIKEYFIIIFLSFGFSLYLIEGYLIFKEKISRVDVVKEKIYKKKTGKNYDQRTKLEFFKELNKKEKDVTLALSPGYYLNKNIEIFPFSGVSNSKTVYCNENGYYSIYDSDRYGFNNPDNEWDKKKTEYLLVGDSFTHGACVNRPNDMASVLRTLSKKTVLNLGYRGNNPLIEYAVLREYLVPGVKNIVWFFFEGNDLKLLGEELSNEILAKYLKDENFSQGLKSKQDKIDFLARKIIEIEKSRESSSFKFYKFLKIVNLRFFLNNFYLSNSNKKDLDNEVYLDFKNILKLTKDLSSKNNSQLYFVYLPEFSRYKSEYDNSNYLKVANIIKELDIPFIDVHEEIFKKETEPLSLFPFNLEGHYNERGYIKVAELIYKFIQENYN